MTIKTAHVVAALGAGVLLLLSSADGGDGSRDAPEPRFVYIRDAATPADAVKRVLATARERGAESIALVLDRVTFDPPPKRNEFTAGYAYPRDLEAWLAAAAADRGGVSVGLSTSERLRGTSPEELAAVTGECNGALWRSTGKGPRLRPAHEWVEDLGSSLKGQRTAIVLVCGDMLPERWIRWANTTATLSGEADPWRSALFPDGGYWDEEKLGEIALKRDVMLFVIAPEAKFGDCQPLDDIPEAPLASRPRARPVADPGLALPPAAPRALPAADRSVMVADLQRRGVDATAIARAMALKEQDLASPPDARPSGRFDSVTARFFPLLGTQLVVNTDCPSGYGVWRLARAAAATGGGYVFYPFPASRWSDACYRDGTLLDALAPALVPRERIAAQARSDRALAAMLAAEDRVRDATPWTDYTKGYRWGFGGNAGWCAFDLPGPKPAKRWEGRYKPIDLEYYWGSDKETATNAARAVEKYRKAIGMLADAAEDPRVAEAPRRSRANLRLCRYWFEQSLFHLQALELAVREPTRFGRREDGGEDDDLGYWRAVRMSDCLPGYDGRIISESEERSYGLRWSEEPQDGTYQGAFLGVPSGDPNYRAERDVERVLANLDERLRPQALAAIRAARDVLKHEAQSPWGWMVYYSELQTYGWSAPETDPSSDRVESEPEKESTPAGSTPPAAPTTPK